MSKQIGIAAIVTAAGRGQRMGSDRNKLLLPLEGMTILERTLQLLAGMEEIERYVLVIRPEDEKEIRSIASRVFCDEPWRLSFAYGGESREASTRNGLKMLPEECNYVLVHDGARPFVATDTIRRVLERIRRDDVDGVICAVPVKDTIKVVRDEIVQTTPRRSTLFAVQTPQAFRADVLIRAYETALTEDIVVTDDSQIVEIFGGIIAVVEGSYENIKITTAEDMLIGEVLLRNRRVK